MRIIYEFGGDDINPPKEFEYDVNHRDFHTYIKQLLSDMDKKTLIDIIMDNDPEYLLNYFEDDVYEHFKDDAYEEFENEENYSI